MPDFKLGRNPFPRSPRMRCPASSFIDVKALPTPPAEFDYTPAAAKSLKNPYLNNQLGDCVIAGYYHKKGVATANAGNEIIVADQEIIHDYGKIGGYNGTPRTDNGCNEQDALHYWQTVGDTRGNKIEGWLTINPQNIDLCVKLCYLFEHLYYGTGIPNDWLNVQNGFTWDKGRGNQNNGHAYVVFGHSSKGFKVSTWGMLGTLTNAAHKQNTDELYVMLDDEIVSKVTAKAPNAFDWPALVRFWNEAGGHLPEPPAPMPTDWMSL